LDSYEYTFMYEVTCSLLLILLHNLNTGNDHKRYQPDILSLE